MIKGIDVSNHNGNIGFNSVKGDGVELVYIKATEGTTFIDDHLEQHYQGAKSVGLAIGFYHFLVGTSAPETQAENFYNQIKDKENNLKPCLDIERSGFDVMDYALRFIARFNQLSKLQILIYAGPYFINANLDSRLAQYPLWVSQYGVAVPMPNNVWGSNYAGHQYTASGSISGISGNCDMDRFTNDILLDGNINQPISQGDDWVRRLQSECNSQGYSGQVVDGLIGPNTLDGCPMVRQGANGNITRLLQEKLVSLGYDTNGVDGDFGGGTYNAVLSFQANNGLSQDGIVGRNTWSKILGM